MSLYLLHVVGPDGGTARFGHAAHYLGYSHYGQTRYRLAHHANGTGANLLKHVRADGLGWHLTRVWVGGTQTHERRIKNSGTLTKVCPLCSPPSQPGTRHALPGGAWIEPLPADSPGRHCRRCGQLPATHRRSWGRGAVVLCVPCAARYAALRHGATLAEVSAGSVPARRVLEAA